MTKGTDNPKLVLVGGGGHCKSVIDAATSSLRPILGIIDADTSLCGAVSGYPILGDDSVIADLIAIHGDGIRFVITVGQIKTSSIRHKIAEKIALAGGFLADPVIASTAHVAATAQVGAGTVVLHHALINADAIVADNCIINSGAIVEHDCRVGAFTHISTGAVINGMSHIGADVFIGSRAVVANCLEVASTAIIGAGAAVIKSITSPGTYCGVPAALTAH